MFLPHQPSVLHVMMMLTLFEGQGKGLSDNSGVMQILYNFPLFAASAIVLNEHRRFLIFCSFKIKCLNMAVIYVLYTLKLKF